MIERSRKALQVHANTFLFDTQIHDAHESASRAVSSTSLSAAHGYGGYGGYRFSLKSTCLRWICPPTKFRFSGWRRCTAAAGQGGQGERSEPEYLIVPFAVRCDVPRPWVHIFLCLQSASFPSGLVAPVSVHHLRSAFWAARPHTCKDFIFRLNHQLGRRLRDLFSWPCDLQSDPPVNLI